MIATNITELIRSPKADTLLRYCNEKLEHTDRSDYAYFLLLCKCLPLLEGHPFLDDLTSLLRDTLQIRTPLSLDTAEQIWKESADFLQAFPMNAQEYVFCKTNENAPEILLSETSTVQSVYRAKSTNLEDQNNWSLWEAELCRLWSKNTSAELIQFSHTGDISQKIPSLYHVEKALQSCQNASSILDAQLLRFLCISCQKAKKKLLVELLSDDATSILSLLEQLEETVGIPDLIISALDTKSLQKALQFAAKARPSEVQIGIQARVEDAIKLIQSIRLEYPLLRLFLYKNEEQGIRLFHISIN